MNMVDFTVAIIFLICLVSGFLVIRNNLKKQSVFRKNKINISAERKNEIKQALERAMKKQAFEVYYQPVFSKFDEIKAAEALLRLNDEEYGEISPEEFIPVAIECGKMQEIGFMVLDTVARFIRDNDMEQLGIQYIEVNLSADECQNQELAEQVQQILNRYDIDKSMINLQISEKTLVEHHSVLIHNMQALNEIGVNFSLDDYGSNSITLAYIMTFPFQFVKIDRSVLWAALEDNAAMQIFGASIDTLKDFSMRIVVEGVESKEAADNLKRLGCDYLQGYYYAKPLCSKDFKDFCLTLDKA